MAVLDVYSSSNFSFDINNKEYCFQLHNIRDYSTQNGNIISVKNFPANSKDGYFLRINVTDNLYSRFSNITKIEFRGRAKAKRSTSLWGHSPAVDGKLYAAYYSSDGAKLFQNQNSITLKDEQSNIKFDITDYNLSESLIRYSSSNQSYVISPGFYITNDSSLAAQDYEIENLTIKIYYQKPWYSLSLSNIQQNDRYTFGTFTVEREIEDNTTVVTSVIENQLTYQIEEEFPKKIKYTVTPNPSDGFKFNGWLNSGSNSGVISGENKEILTIQKELNSSNYDIDGFKTVYKYSPLFHFVGYKINLNCISSDNNFGSIYLSNENQNSNGYYDENSTAIIKIELNDGYRIEKILIDGEEQTLSSNIIDNYEISPIRKSMNVEITVESMILTITPIEAENGTISPNTEQKINYNSNSEIFTFRPKTGYILKDIKINNQLINWSQNYLTYQFKNVKQDYTIEPIFVKQIQLSPKSNQILYLGAKNNIQIKIS